MKTSQGELLMKEVLDYIITGTPQEDNYRSSWLEGLELDRYYPELKIAFEYQGAQHTRYVPRYHSTYNDLRTIKRHDREKRKYCRQRQIPIVYVEHWQLSVGQIAQAIRKRLLKKGTPQPKKRWMDPQSVAGVMDIVCRYHKGKAGAAEINRRCRTYKRYVKAQKKSGAWKAYMPGKFRKREYKRNRRRRAARKRAQALHSSTTANRQGNERCNNGTPRSDRKETAARDGSLRSMRMDRFVNSSSATMDWP